MTFLGGTIRVLPPRVRMSRGVLNRCSNSCCVGLKFARISAERSDHAEDAAESAVLSSDRPVAGGGMGSGVPLP